jgi:hypothetical protein
MIDFGALKMSEVRTYCTHTGDYVVSENGTWLPGVYDSEETARYAATLSDDVLVRAQPICETRPITRLDLSLLSADTR